MLGIKNKKPVELAKIGDPLVNFLFSLALSKAGKRPIGKKVSNYILSEALIRSGLRDRAGSRVSREDLGDYAEGLIFIAWDEGKITLEEAVNILSENLDPTASGNELKELSIASFENLLKKVVEKCPT
jgi:hypothetical protein